MSFRYSAFLLRDPELLSNMEPNVCAICALGFIYGFNSVPRVLPVLRSGLPLPEFLRVPHTQHSLFRDCQQQPHTFLPG